MPGVADWQQRGHVGTRTNQGSRIDYITEKPDLHHQLRTNLGLLVDAGWG